MIERSDDEPRWLRVAAAFQAEPGPRALARALERIGSRASGPLWVSWLARPAALLTAGALLVVSVAVGGLLLARGAEPSSCAC